MPYLWGATMAAEHPEGAQRAADQQHGPLPVLGMHTSLLRFDDKQ